MQFFAFKVDSAHRCVSIVLYTTHVLFENGSRLGFKILTKFLCRYVNWLIG